MTIGDNTPPRFQRGQRLTAAALNQLSQAVAAILNRGQGPRVDRHPIIVGKLDGNLDAATSFADDPSTATLSVWEKNSDGDYEDSGRDETVTNRFENLSFTAGQIMEAEFRDGEWKPKAADCS